jgi:hypothetical protein
VEIRERLAGVNFQRHGAELAGANQRLVLLLLGIEAFEPAVVEKRRVVEIFEALSQGDLQTYGNPLIGGIVELLDLVEGTGDADGALAASDQMVQIQQRLFEVDHDRLPQLVTAMHNHAVRLARGGDLEQAEALLQTEWVLIQEYAAPGSERYEGCRNVIVQLRELGGGTDSGV